MSPLLIPNLYIELAPGRREVQVTLNLDPDRLRFGKRKLGILFGREFEKESWALVDVLIGVEVREHDRGSFPYLLLQREILTTENRFTRPTLGPDL